VKRHATARLGLVGLVLALTLGLTSASSGAAAAQPLPPRTTATGMAYQPGAAIPRTHLPELRFTTAAATTLRSFNWSGYVAEACGSCKLRYVAATFTLPSFNCANSPDNSWAAYWVGLDGATSGSVEQTGIEANCTAGTANYFAFYEMYPLAPVAFSGVNPGDSLTAAVYWNAATNQWQLGLTDQTTGGSIATSQPCPSSITCANVNAEVITEAPSAGSTTPLADFGTSTYANIAVTSRNGTRGAMTSNGLWTAYPINLEGASGDTLAAPGPAWAGSAFLDTWHAAQ